MEFPHRSGPGSMCRPRRARKAARTCAPERAPRPSPGPSLDNLYYAQGRVPRVATPQRLVHGAGPHGPRPPAAALGQDRGTPAPRREGRQLPVGRVPPGPAPRQQPRQPRHPGRSAGRRSPALGLDLDELLRAGRGAGARQRRAGPARRLLHGLPRHARESRRIGYGIRYEFGIFDQEIRDGWQVEVTDKWLRFGNPWEIPRPEIAYDVKLRRPHRGLPRTSRAASACAGSRTQVVKGMAYDTPVLGYRRRHVNMLRLWKAEAVESFDFAGLQRRRLLRRGRGEGRSRRPSPRCSIPTTSRRRARSCACAAVLLRLLLAAGHDPHLPRAQGRQRSSASTRSSPSSSTTPTRPSPWPS